MSQYKISVSKIAEFHNMLTGQYGVNQASFIDYMMGIKEKTYKQSKGDLIHAYIEDKLTGSNKSEYVIHQAALDGITIDPLTEYEEGFFTEYASMFKGIKVECEKWLLYECEFGEDKLFVSGRVDLRLPSMIRDIKTSGNAYSFNYRHYNESPQWKLYCMIEGVNIFVYDHFQLQKKRIIHTEDAKEFEPIIGDEMNDLVRRLLRFCKLHGLEKYIRYDEVDKAKSMVQINNQKTLTTQ
jgi:hypothetical protein